MTGCLEAIIIDLHDKHNPVNLIRSSGHWTLWYKAFNDKTVLKNCNIIPSLLQISVFFSFFCKKISIPLILLTMNSLNYQANTGSLTQTGYMRGIVCSNFRPEKLVLRFRRPFMPRT